ncbi:MAG: 50S ribosomal protein L3 [Candidatus Margulisbacteria bacterium]|nr:50S ribosomal protein L3 [Candidatus Margulisiibacteriota bacterium]
MKGLLGKKIGMTQVFDAHGKVVPVTVLEVGPCVVTQKKTLEKDKYEALQIGFGELQERKANKALKNHFAKAKKMLKEIKEIKVDQKSYAAIEVGQELNANLFKKDEMVKVSGYSIGKGFAGGIKRWNFARQPMTHGCKARRLPGSMGASDRGGKIFKGKRMGGRLGNTKTTIHNIKIVDIDGNIMLLKGAVPGPKNGIVFIYNNGKFDFSLKNKPEDKQVAQVVEQKKQEKVAETPTPEVKKETTSKKEDKQ